MCCWQLTFDIDHVKIVKELRNVFPDGVPLDEPVCLFDGSACDNATMIVVIITLVTVIAIGSLSYWCYKRRQRQQLIVNDLEN